MLDVKFGNNLIEITSPPNNHSEIVISDEYLVFNGMRIAYDDDVKIIIQKRKAGASAYIEMEADTTKTEANSPSKKTKRKSASDKPITFGTPNPNKNLTNDRYVVQAIEELGRPFTSLKDIKNILATNGYVSTAKNPDSSIRFYLTDLDEITKMPNGMWGLKKWLNDPNFERLIRVNDTIDYPLNDR